MSVVLPEVDGRIITRAVSFKGTARRSERAQIDIAEYSAEPERAQFVAALAAHWVELARTPASERRVALVLANYPARDGRLGNGVGLDTPASTIAILRALEAHGYPVEGVPADGTALMQRLTTQVTNDLALLDTRPDSIAGILAGSSAKSSADHRHRPAANNPATKRLARRLLDVLIVSVRRLFSPLGRRS